MTRRLLPLAAVGLLASLAACGDSEPDVAPTATVASTTTVSPTTRVEGQAGAVTEQSLGYATWEERTLTLDMHVPAEPDGASIVIAPSTVPSVFAPLLELAEGLVEVGAIVVYVELDSSADSGEEILSDHGAAVRAMAEQLACAIHFARAQAFELGSDDPEVVLTAFSVDGGVAAHAALFGATLEARWDEFAAAGGPPRRVDCEVTDGSTHVDALVGMAGAYDAFVPIYDGVWGRAYQQERDPELWEFLSSSIGANPDLKVRLLHGETDVTVSLENSVEFEAALIDAGYDVQFASFDGGHEPPPTELSLSTIREVLGR